METIKLTKAQLHSVKGDIIHSNWVKESVSFKTSISSYEKSIFELVREKTYHSDISKFFITANFDYIMISILRINNEDPIYLSSMEFPDIDDYFKNKERFFSLLEPVLSNDTGLEPSLLIHLSCRSIPTEIRDDFLKDIYSLDILESHKKVYVKVIRNIIAFYKEFHNYLNNLRK